MARAVFTNNARTTLSAGINNSVTSIGVVDGSVFPSPTAGDYAYLTIEEGALIEVVKVTARSTNTLTVTRAQDGTTGQTFTTAATISLRLPKIVLDEIWTGIDAKLNSSAVSAFGLTLVDDADASAARTTLGLGTSATVNTGTSGATIPLLNGVNTWAGIQTFSVASEFTLGADFGTGTEQSDALIRIRKTGNNIEFGHTNTAGYGSQLGAEAGSGSPFIAFGAEAGTTNNTYRTRGLLGAGIKGDNAGGITFFTLTNSSADNQSPTVRGALSAAGQLSLGLGSVSAPAFTFTGDLNTGVYSAGADSVSITTGGTARVKVNNANTQTAEIVGQINLTTAMGTQRTKLDWGITQSGLTIRNVDSTPLSLGTSDTNRLMITALGEVYMTDVGPTQTLAVGYRGTPVNRQDSSYTLVLTDAGKAILKGTGTAGQTYTIPANSSVPYPVGTVLTFLNLGSVSCSIAITTDSMYLSPGGATGTRTLAAVSVATAVKVDSTNWMISGAGLS